MHARRMRSQLHRDPDFWENPLEFEPRRFLRTTEHGRPRHTYQYMPFGGGPRSCVGSTFAMMEAKIIIIMLLQRFDVALTKGQVVCPQIGITMKPRYGILMDVCVAATATPAPTVR
jgi:cytochrome P450